MHPLALPADDLLRIVAEARRSLAFAWDLRTELLELAFGPDVTGTRVEDGHDAPAAVPEAIPDGSLARAGLLCGGRLRVRVSKRRSQVFVTDPAGPDEIDAVTPLLLQLARQAWGVPDVLLDPYCGNGEVALSIEAPLRLMLDRDPRALAFADLNRVLNGIPESRTLLGLADLRMGLPRLALAALSGTVVCVAMLPPDTRGANERSLQQAALDAIAAARRMMPRTARLRALIGLVVAPRADRDGRDLAGHAAAAFGANRVSWSVIEPASTGWVDVRAEAGEGSYGALAVELD
jgi:hypothetical protein